MPRGIWDAIKNRDGGKHRPNQKPDPPPVKQPRTRAGRTAADARAIAKEIGGAKDKVRDIQKEVNDLRGRTVRDEVAIRRKTKALKQAMADFEKAKKKR